jgi:hypothetical protein
MAMIGTPSLSGRRLWQEASQGASVRQSQALQVRYPSPAAAAVTEFCKQNQVQLSSGHVFGVQGAA